MHSRSGAICLSVLVMTAVPTSQSPSTSCWAGPGLAVTHGHAGAGDGPGEACPVPLCGLCRVFKIYGGNGRPLLYLHSTTSRISSQTVIRYHHTWCRVT